MDDQFTMMLSGMMSVTCMFMLIVVSLLFSMLPAWLCILAAIGAVGCLAWTIYSINVMTRR